jgi:flagellar protein FliJ
MKSHDALIRLKTFQVEDKRRKVVQIEAMIADFERMANDLDREIRVEQDRSGIHDPSHYAYPTYAKAALARRDNLRHSAEELRTQLADAKVALQEACDERRKVELLGERERSAEARGQSDVDPLAILRSRAALA